MSQESGILPMLEPPPVDAEALTSMRTTLQRAWSQRPHRAPRPFLVITPLAWPHRDKVTQGLSAAGILVQRREPIDDWPERATLLYVQRLDEERLRLALLYEHAWQSLGIPMRAELWTLAERSDLERVGEVKRHLRCRLPAVRLAVGSSAPGLPVTIALHALHSPEGGAIAREWQALESKVSEFRVSGLRG